MKKTQFQRDWIAIHLHLDSLPSLFHSPRNLFRITNNLSTRDVTHERTQWVFILPPSPFFGILYLSSSALPTFSGYEKEKIKKKTVFVKNRSNSVFVLSPSFFSALEEDTIFWEETRGIFRASYTAVIASSIFFRRKKGRRGREKYVFGGNLFFSKIRLFLWDF